MKKDSIPKEVKQALTKYRKTLDMDTLDRTISKEIKGMDKEQQHNVLMWLSWSLIEL